MKTRLISGINFLAPVAVWFCIVFTLLRVYEFAQVGEFDDARALEAKGFLYDWPFACTIALVVIFFGIILSLLHSNLAKIATTITYSVLIISSLFIIQYFSVTHVPLSADLFGYSFSDIKTTVSSSGGIDVGTGAVIFLHLLFFISGVYFISRFVAPRAGIGASGTIIILLLIIALIPAKHEEESYHSEAQFHLVVSKPKFFLDRSFEYFNERDVSVESIKQNTSYPFYHKVNYRDVLGKHFNFRTERPNLVFLFVEGLGADFAGPDAMYSGYTPFLDSLIGKSLYWKNALSNAGRTFGVLPSALGSLPYGKDGFLSYGISMPDHQTLISIMKKNGYTANYFYGGNPNFDNQDIFLQYQGVDYFLNESNFPMSYLKARENDEGFSWGYNDRDVLNYSLEVLRERKSLPRIDIYLTLTTHEPFISPDAKFDQAVEESLRKDNLTANVKSVVSEFSGIFSCLLYTDDAIRSFFKQYSQLPEYANTIFIITGDHRLIPIPQYSKISRYRVPLIIYSPMLKQSKTFSSVVTHSDLPEAILGMLAKNFNFKVPAEMPFISEQLDTMVEFSSKADVALMRNKGEITDYIYGKYYLSGRSLFTIDSTLNIDRVSDDSVLDVISEKINSFKIKSIVACGSNHVDKIGSGRKFKAFTLTHEEETFLESQSLINAIPDILFRKAQEFAFKEKYHESKIVLRYLLNKTPNFHDARLLLGRTFAWQEQYDTAKVFFQEVLSRSPAYEDAFAAMSDVAYWEKHVDVSLGFAEGGLKHNPNNPDLLSRKARGLLATGKNIEAEKITTEVLKRIPTHELALEINLKSKQ